MFNIFSFNYGSNVSSAKNVFNSVFLVLLVPYFELIILENKNKKILSNLFILFNLYHSSKF